MNGKIIYSESDKSFDFIPKESADIYADIYIAIAYLNLGFDSEEMKAQLIWGFNPKESWNDISHEPPTPFKGEILLLEEYEPGETWRIDKEEMWESYYNSDSGWFCIGDPNQEVTDVNVEFATDVIAVLQSNGLKALWFKFDFTE